MISKTLLVFFSLISSHVFSQDFRELWERANLNSKEQKASKFETSYYELQTKRLKKHYLPQVYLRGNWFNTDDPGSVLFNHMGQRRITQMDFSPASLNYPKDEAFFTASLGIRLPLYEGGMKQNELLMTKAMLKAARANEEAKKTDDYKTFTTTFVHSLIFQNATHELNDLKVKLGKILKNYKIGNSKNTVGHSGLLGLLSLKNRLTSITQNYELENKKAHTYLSIKTGLQKIEIKEKRNLKTFIKDELNFKNNSMYSKELEVNILKAQSLSYLPKLERSRFLPHVGLFYENQRYTGHRDTKDARTIGLYFMWDIFNNNSYGRVSEARAKERLEKSKISHFKEEEKITRINLIQTKKTLEKNLKLLEESSTLLTEQTMNMMKLFRSSLITALELSEVLNRRVDLISEKVALQKNYLEVTTTLFKLNN